MLKHGRQFSASVPASNGAFFRYGFTDPPSLSWDHACGGPLPPHPVARRDSHAPLQPTHGRGVCAMGASLHSLLRFAPSPRARAERRDAFSLSLAVDANVSASTQNQALAAIVFLYRDVLNMPVGWLNTLVRAKRPGRVPVVFTRDEVRKLFAQPQCRGGGAATLVI